MVDVGGEWNQAQLAQFLTEATVPVRIGCHHPDGGLWMLSLWYQYADEEIRCATNESAAVTSFLRKNEEVSFEISTNHPPYMGVRGKGWATLAPDPEKTLLKTLLERYLGGTENTLGRRLLSPNRKEVVISIEPERLYTWDFSERMQDVNSGESKAETDESSGRSVRSPKFGSPASE